jgi:tetratricopeptide (TPR) repeat protein
MTLIRTTLCAGLLFLCFAAFSASGAPWSVNGAKLAPPPNAYAALEKIYSGDPDAGIEEARLLQQEQPGHPLGYLLEAEALWWKIWCTTADFKYGMTNARHREKLAADQRYLGLTARVSSLAEAQIRQHETAEMQFYAGTGDALAARFYGLRWEGRNTARAGVRAREHFLRALTLDPDLADADLGLGLYNYYADTLSAMARVLRFFMGIPGGTKQEGIRRLQHDIGEGVLTQPVARFYLAVNLHNYDQKYEQALAVIGPLVDKYPTNPLFQLVRGDLYAKLSRKPQALECYRAAATLPVRDAECRAHIQELVRAALAAIGASTVSAEH